MHAIIATVVLAQFVMMGPDEIPPARTLFSPTESARWALEHVCGPAVAADQPIPAGRGLRPFRREPEVMVVLGSPHVAVRQERGNACYLRVGRGDPQGLRAMVLERLHAAGTRPTLVSDRQMSGRAGEFRVERYCLDFAGRAGGMMMTTALRGNGYKLQLTLYPRAAACEGAASQQPESP